MYLILMLESFPVWTLEGKSVRALSISLLKNDILQRKRSNRAFMIPKSQPILMHEGKKS